jgi:hypothetical protein
MVKEKQDTLSNYRENNLARGEESSLDGRKR